MESAGGLGYALAQSAGDAFQGCRERACIHQARGYPMFCRHCGKEVKDKAVVCSGCGNAIVEGGETLAATPRRWHWFTMFVTIGVIIVLLLIAIIAGL
jgi:predicted amidophosphoribosyltransferase